MFNNKNVSVLRKISYLTAIVLLFSIIIITPAQKVEAATLQVSNNSFETLVNGFPSSWTKPYTYGYESSSTTRVYSGTRSIKINDTSSSGAGGVRSSAITVIPGRQYTADIKCYIESGTSVSIYLEFWNSSDLRMSEVHSDLTTKGSWQTISVTGTVPLGASYVTILAFSPTANVGVSYFDYASLSTPDLDIATGLSVTNSGFENADASGFPVDWTSNGTSSFVSGSTSMAFEGTRSIKINDTGTGASVGARSQYIPIVEGRQYTAKVKCYNQSGRGFAYVEFWDAANYRMQETHVQSSQVGTWETVSISGVAPFGAKYATILIYSDYPNTGVSYFDAAAIYLNGVSVSNGSFENIDLNGYPTNWNAYLNSASVITSGSTARTFDVKRSLKISDSSASASGGARSSNITGISPGKEYEANAKCYIESGSIDMYLEFWNSDDTRIGVTSTTMSTAGSWQDIGVSGTAPAGTSYATILLYSAWGNTGTAYFDSVSIEPTVVNLNTKKQLFIDDYLIKSMTNVTRTLNQATKSPIVMSEQYAWEGVGSDYPAVYVYGTVMKDEQENIYKMWYQSAVNSYTCYATSTDGVNWNKPLNLGIINYNGNTNNNILGVFHLPSVVKDINASDPNKRYKMLTWPNANSWYCTYYSPDGLHWTKAADAIAGRDVCTMAYDSDAGKYIAVVKHQDGLRRVARISTSSDFVNWSTPIRMNSLSDDIDAQGYYQADCYGMGIYPYEGVYIGFDWMFKTTDYALANDGPVDVQLAFSRDLTEDFLRPSRTPIIPLGSSGSFDDGMIFTASYPIKVGNEIWLYYGGWDDTHRTGPRAARMAIAKWRIDGFMSLNSGSTEGNIETKKLTFTGSKLSMNVNSSGTGNYVKVELCDSNGNIIPGYSANDCNIINIDNVNHTVAWGGSSNISSLAGQEIIVKLYTKGAKLYSMQFGN